MDPRTALSSAIQMCSLRASPCCVAFAARLTWLGFRFGGLRPGDFRRALQQLTRLARLEEGQGGVPLRTDETSDLLHYLIELLTIKLD